VSAGFPPLRNNDVSAGSGRGSCFLGSTDRDENDCAGLACFADDAARVAPENETIRTPAASAAASRSRWSHAKPRFTPKGRCVSCRVSSTTVAISAGDVHVIGSIPSPPAFDTAAAKVGVTAPPIGASTTGASIPRRSHSGVRTERV